MAEPPPDAEVRYFACTTSDCENRDMPVQTWDSTMISEVQDGTAVCGTCYQRLTEVAAPS